jgi:uncharacterized protein
LAAKLTEVEAVTSRLLAALPGDEADWRQEHRACGLIARMFEWHRREDKSAWWEYFRLCELSDEELQEDKNALGGLVYVGQAGEGKRSIIHRYQFPPQDHSIDRALDVHDPRTQRGVGTIVEIDDRNRTIDIKRGTSSTVQHPTALIPCEIVNSDVLRQSLLRMGSWIADNHVDGNGSFRAGRDLLLRLPPRVRGDFNSIVRGDMPQTELAKRLVLSLDESVLPIQGPPGSGKTYTGARMVIELVRSGKRVGITAVSHKVISNLLRDVCAAARERGVSLSAIQKVEKGEGCVDECVRQVRDNGPVVEALHTGKAQVAAGTPWLWARDETAGAVDVLFVDEAGQMSLANVLAASQGATNLVLLGDPQQLEQPLRGVHPPGVDVSALAHILDGRATIGEDQGLFLRETWRLHPDICAFISELFYDGRLRSRPDNARQRLNTKGALDGTGLRFVPVEHLGNLSESPEEVEKVGQLIEGLLASDSTWTDRKSEQHRLSLADILVVAPYNAEVSALASRLPEGARVGTVDKFQGQEAPIVVYSMTTSTPEDAPRGMEFLYSLNRLNVAISRARCVAVLVASPALFQVQCRTPRQMELANAFCRYLEMARSV